MAPDLSCPTVHLMANPWRPCTRDARYEVSWDGRVRNAKTGRVLKPGTAKSGRYAKVCLGRAQQAQIHQLVAETWLGAKPMGMPQVVDHIDNNGHRNCVTNLQWQTYSMNTRNYYAWQGRILADAHARGADELTPMNPDELAEYARRWGDAAAAEYEAQWGPHHELAVA